MSSGTASSVTISSKTLSSEALSSGRERTLELQVVNLQAGISSKKSEQQQNFLFQKMRLFIVVSELSWLG